MRRGQWHRSLQATSLPIAALARDIARLLETLAAPGGGPGADAGAIRI